MENETMVQEKEYYDPDVLAIEWPVLQATEVAAVNPSSKHEEKQHDFLHADKWRTKRRVQIEIEVLGSEQNQKYKRIDFESTSKI